MSKALELAKWHEAMAAEPKRNEGKRKRHGDTAEELRRLADIEQEHRALLVNEQNLREELEAQVEQATQPVAQGPIGYMNAGHVYELQQRRIHYGYVYPKEGTGAEIPVYTSPPKAAPLTEEQSRLATEAVNEVMEQAQVFASAYSLIGSRFDGGNAQYDSEEEKAELRAMVVSLAYEAAHGITKKGG
jgi:hypothetical protein